MTDKQMPSDQGIASVAEMVGDVIHLDEFLQGLIDRAIEIDANLDDDGHEYELLDEARRKLIAAKLEIRAARNALAAYSTLEGRRS